MEWENSNSDTPSKAYILPNGDLRFEVSVPDFTHLMMTPLNGRVNIVEEPYDDYGCLHISIAEDLFNGIPDDWLHSIKDDKKYLCANKREIDFLSSMFCLDKEELERYDYFKFIIKEKV